MSKPNNVRNLPQTVGNPALEEQVRKLMERNAALEARLAEANKPRAMSMKVSEKGGLSVYGLGRFPVTLYREQWERLLGHGDSIREFIAAHSSELKVKGAE